MTVISASNGSVQDKPSFVAMMGGTFDPIHHGHLRTALELKEQLQPDRLLLVPCHRPPHRDQPTLSAQQRLQMVKLAITDEPGLVADDRELRSERTSYTVDTLASLRQELGPDCVLAMVIGTDALLGLTSWHRWQALLTLAHIVVVRRPGWELPPDHPLTGWLEQHQVADVEALRQQPAGAILWQPITPLAIAATDVRNTLRAGRSPRYLIPDSVWNFIRAQGLYDTSQH